LRRSEREERKMSRFLVLGAGKMGLVLAKDLIESSSRNIVTLADISSLQLKKAEKFIKSRRLKTVQMDVEDKKQVEEIFDGHDVVLAALLHKHSLLAFDASVRKGIHFVDLVGEKPAERLQYDREARKKRITLISGLGVSPGITNVCVGRAAHLLDETEKAMIYVGGNPIHPTPPLHYRIVYAVDSVLSFYQRPVQILKKGKIKKVRPLSGIESVSFASFPEMECFYTDGLHSLLRTMKGRIKDELFEKTIRHKGHAQGVKTLKECGLFSARPVHIGQEQVIPRKFLGALLDSKMKLGKEKDVTLLRVIVSGRKLKKPITHVFEMVDFFDSKRNYTSMAKTTTFPASIAAQMIASGRIRRRGSLFPEDVFHAELYNPFINELKKRGVLVSHKIV
jgi:lysine 6-dehydrogenase